MSAATAPVQERDPRGWLRTFTGGQFWPLDPRVEEVDVNDIAHALSNLCRFGGHCREFYSVAQHSVLVANLLRMRGFSVVLQFAVLLHDASEAYLIDLPRPIKHAPGFEIYREAEARVMTVIAKRFELGNDSAMFELPTIKAFDQVMLATEQRDLMNKAVPDGAAAEFRIQPETPFEAETKFLQLFNFLSSEVRR